MKYFYPFIFACLLLPGGCINLPEPEFPGDSTEDIPGNEVTDVAVSIAGVTTSGSYILVTAGMNPIYYGGRLADEVGIYVDNVPHTGIISANRTAFECSFYAAAGVTYTIRAYAKFGSQYFYSAYREVSLQPGGVSPAASIVSECLALSDGLYYYFNPSANTDVYYFSSYSQSELPGSDNAIISDLLAYGIEHEVDDNDIHEGYAYDLDPNTTYTLCVLVIDRQGGQTLEKRNFTTKSATNQPVAAINISSVSYGTIYYTTTRSGTCTSYVLTGYYNLSSQDINLPDIYWASACYDDYKVRENIYTINLNTSWQGWSGTSVVVSLGFTSGGVSGGVISKQLFSATPGSLLTASAAHPAMMRSAQELQKTPKTAKTTSKRNFGHYFTH
ncbi:MAG: hypothetical protein LBK18_00430 [Prevotellaceae bacterium]|jgi:hypothetical protein|nr:hypothetical protein [Prevotellaceae bacterium]